MKPTQGGTPATQTAYASPARRAVMRRDPIAVFSLAPSADSGRMNPCDSQPGAKRAYTASIRSHQRGVSIVAALFLIVVLAAVGAFAVQIGASQQQTVNLTLLQTRAQAAANAGIEWASNRALVANICPTGLPPPALTEGALAGFTVRITAPNPCSTVHSVGPVANTRLYTFTATATRGAYGSPDFVSRSVTRTVSNAALPP